MTAATSILGATVEAIVVVVVVVVVVKTVESSMSNASVVNAIVGSLMLMLTMLKFESYTLTNPVSGAELVGVCNGTGTCTMTFGSNMCSSYHTRRNNNNIIKKKNCLTLELLLLL